MLTPKVGAAFAFESATGRTNSDFFPSDGVGVEPQGKIRWISWRTAVWIAWRKASPSSSRERLWRWPLASRISLRVMIALGGNPLAPGKRRGETGESDR